MKKNAKRFLALALALMMVLGAAPLSGFVGLELPKINLFASNAEAATEPEIYENTDLVYGSNGTITRIEWLHNLTVIFEMTVAEDNVPDNYFADLTEDSEYYKDAMLATEFGVVDIAAGENLDPAGTATREFAAQTLNYCLGFTLQDTAYTFSDIDAVTYDTDAQVAINRGWFSLVNGAFNPEQNVTTAEVNVMIADAQAVLESAEIDYTTEDTFEFADNVIVVPADTYTEIDGNTVRILSCPEEIKAGNVFAVFVNELPVIYTAVEVNTTNSLTEITAEKYEEDDAITEMTASGQVEVYASQFVPAEGVTVIEDSVQTYSRDTKPLSSIKVKGEISLGDGSKATYTAKITNLKLDYDIDFWDSYYKVGIGGNVSIDFGLYTDAVKESGWDKSLVLGTVSVAGIGSIEISLNYELTGQIIYTGSCYVYGGFQYDGLNFRFEKSFEKTGFSVAAEAKGKLYIELFFKFDVYAARGEIYVQSGVEGRLKYNMYNDGELPNECTTVSAWFFAKCGAFVELGKGKLSESFGETVEVYNEKNSPIKVYFHYEDGREVSECSRGKEYITPSTSKYGSSGMRYGSSTGKNSAGEVYTKYEYTLDEEENATITKYYGNAATVIIPETLDGYKVVGIHGSAFYKNTNLRSVTIPNSVTSIGSYAFYYCTNLSSVKLSNNIVNLDAFAFGYCTSLTSIFIPKSLDYASTYGTAVDKGGPFAYCSNLKNVKFEDGTSAIASCLFDRCTGLTSIIIPDSVATIESVAFSKCSNLTTVKIGDSVSEIGSSAFSGCSSLAEISIPDSVTKINTYAFSDCISLSSVKLSNNLTYLDAFSFGGCTSLTSIFIPKSLVDSSAYGTAVDKGGPFAYCSSLENVEFEEGISVIASCLFNRCTGLSSISIPDTVSTIENGAFSYCTNLVSAKIGNSVTEIGSSAFSECASLSTVEIGKAVTTIGDEAFINTALKNLILPNSLTRIGDYTFSGCEKLEEVTLSNRLNHLGLRAFGNCNSLTEILIPKSLSSVRGTESTFYSYAGGPFINCSNLSKVEFEEGRTEIPQYLFGGCTGLTEIEIPDTITTIEKLAFRDCTNLVSVKLNEGITGLSEQAFYNCTNLNDIVIPETVTSIGESAFRGCVSLKEIEINNPDAKIAEYAFDGCKALENVVLPKNLATINKGVFRNCTSLKSINFPETLSSINKLAFYNCDSLEIVELPDSVTTIETEVFRDLDSLIKVVIPNSVTEMSSYVFAECDNLSNVKLGNGLTTIPTYAFADCPSIEEIEIPKGVTTIGANAFRNCTGLKKIIIPVTVTSIDTTALSYPDRTVIYGCTGTYAETFATENGFEFVDITKHITGMILKDNDEELVTITKGYYATPEFEYLPADTTDVITLASNNTSIVTVSGNKLYGRANGSATVTATTTGGLEYTFNVYVHTLSSISVSSQPTKTSYKYGEELDLTGLGITATYGDGMTEIITDYTVSGYDPDVYGTQTVTVTYNGKKVTFTVEVIDDRTKLTSIAITKLPNKIAYEKGEAFDSTGMIVTGYYSDGTSAPVTGYTVSTMNSLKTGTQTLTVTYEEFTATFTVTVGMVSATLSSIAIKANPNKTVYIVGDSFDSTGLVLTATYSDGSTKEITSGYSVGGFSSTSVGTKTVTITYEGKTTTFNVTVKENESDIKETYTITFNSNGGSSVNPITAEEGSAISMPVNPTKTGYTFAGWMDTNGNSVSVPSTMPSYNMTLYAKWAVNSYTVIWIVDGEKTAETYKYGAAIINPANPSKDGYTFKGWTPDVPSTMPAYDLTFTAVFEKNDTPVVPSEPVKADVIKQPTQTTISYGDAIILHVDASKIPAGGYVEWSADNGNFTYSANGDTCRIDPNKSGSTTFTATIYDAQGNAVAKDEQTMTSKAGFFDKIIAFFKKLFSLTKVIQQSLNTIY